jgi:hypothetical protein
MTRKSTRNDSPSVIAPFIAFLTLLIAATVLAQTSGVERTSGKAEVVTHPPLASPPAQAQRSLIPWTDDAGRSPVGPSLPKPSSAGPLDLSPPLFLPAVFYDSGGGAFSVAVADVNGDGKPDLLVANDMSCTVGVLLGNGDGTFQVATTFDIGGGCPLEIAAGDLNGDGKPDIVLTTVSTSTILVMLGNGDGTFQAPVAYGLGSRAFNPYQVVIADVNGDGKPDLVVAEEAEGYGSLVCVLLGNGDGTFQAAATYGTGGDFAHSVAVADVNGDGKPDLVVTNSNSSSVGVLLGIGDGTFLPAVTYPTGGGAFWVAIADVNGDGKPDVLVANWTSNSVGVLLGNGDGTFQAPVTYSSGGAEPWGIAVADVNGDGKLDILVANAGSGSVGVLLGNGDGTFQAPVTYGSGQYSTSIVATDVNGDGKPDLVLADGSFCNCWNEGGVALLLSGTGPRNPTTTILTSTASPAAPGQTVTYTAIVKTEPGGAATGTVTLMDGSNMVAIVGLVGNQIAWSTSYTKAGVHTITAEYPGDANTTGSTSATLTEHIAILPVPSKTQIATSGSPSFVGQPVRFTATVTSQYGTIPDGETVTFYNGTTEMGTGTTAGGVANYTTSSLTAKTHAIKATYSGDATFLPSSRTVTQVVNKYTTTTALVSSLNPSNYGQRVTLTATVTPTGPYQPTGTVTFRNGSVILGSVALNASGVATLTTTKIPVGTDALTATYNGDAFNGKSVSAAITQTVRQASISMVLTSYPNPSTFGASVKFTAKLTSNGGLPSGQPVTFSYNGATLGTANVNTGVATFSTITLPRGSDAVTAAYAGSVDYSSASATVTQVVN